MTTGACVFPRALVEDMIANTAHDLTFYGQDEKFDLDLRGERVHTYGGGEAVTMLDPGACNLSGHLR